MAEKAGKAESLESLIVEYRLLQGLSADLQQRITLLSTFLNELQAAINTIEGAEKTGEGAEVLIPIGGASYIKAKLTHGDKVIVGIGAGVAVEKSLGGARKFFEERVSEVSQALASVQGQLTSIMSRMSQIEPKIREALEAREAKKAS
ncbi:MAG: prefoldin subunit alpha [Candidatus Nezhaarchaeota archaeon]|nr:prefoldin subunit alpha [Candidatus Nezhaarchaeota archaeon]